MKRLSSNLALLLAGLVLVVSGCASDPNVEGAKLDLRNEDYASALENVNTALERNPENAEAHLLKGQILGAMAGREQTDLEEHNRLVGEMLQSFERAVEVDPGMADQVEQARMQAYVTEYQRGGQAFNRGQEDASAYTEAASYFANAGRIQPDSAAAFTNQAYALLNAGENEQAIEPLRQSIEMGGDTADNYYYLGQLLMSADRTEEVIPLLQEAQEKYPDNRDIQNMLMNAYITTGQTEQALENYEAAVQQEPENATYRYNYGTLLLNEGRHADAVEQFQRAVEIDPDYSDAYYNLGAAHVNQAVEVTNEIQELDDQLRSEQANLSEAEIQDLENEIQSLDQERRDLFQEAIEPLETAKQMAEQQGNDPQRICEALFSAYVQTGQEEQAQAVSECAGYNDE